MWRCDLCGKLNSTGADRCHGCESRAPASVNIPYLPPDRAMLSVAESRPCMQLARKAAEELSLDSEHPTGAAVIKAYGP